MTDPVLIIACGALAREINALKTMHGWEHLHMKCIDAKLHFWPEKIGAELRERIQKYRADYEKIYVAYAECGTAGEIDRIVEEEGLERLPGAHCYQFFAGSERFDSLADEEPGTFYLTDFLVRHFRKLVVVALGIDRHPELRDAYFGNYRRVLYLAQTHDETLIAEAKSAAEYLRLDFEYLYTGYGELESSLQSVTARSSSQ
jgi:hypothetical protein